MSSNDTPRLYRLSASSALACSGGSKEGRSFVTAVGKSADRSGHIDTAEQPVPEFVPNNHGERIGGSPAPCSAGIPHRAQAG